MRITDYSASDVNVTVYFVRATFSKGEVKKGDNVLVTGIGGGVALFALQFAVAAGANVYVTSSKEDKIQRAIELGAKGGVNYRKGMVVDGTKG
jgi:zinc-binding alcohol dehydrogenase/oxidoreductase